MPAICSLLKPIYFNAHLIILCQSLLVRDFSNNPTLSSSPSTGHSCYVDPSSEGKFCYAISTAAKPSPELYNQVCSTVPCSHHRMATWLHGRGLCSHHHTATWPWSLFADSGLARGPYGLLWFYLHWLSCCRGNSHNLLC